ncbi:MAG TPA: peptidase S8 [Actinospica sp.]|jgi:subtilase family serine protease|nr:peptidase S8 [Actinospica sp.]
MSVFELRGRGRRRLAAVPVLAAAVSVALTTAAMASAGTPSATGSATANSGETVAAVAQQVQNGTLLRTHGTHRVCAHCDAEVVTTAKNSDRPLSSSQPAGYGPAGLASAYGLPSTSSSTATIAIIDAGVDGHLAADLATYRKEYGLPACTTANGCLHLENYTGGAQPAPQKSGEGAALEEDVAVETSLDVDMASAACGSCHIVEISVPWQDGEDDNDVSTGDFAKAVNTAVAAHASAVSISYGYSTDATNTRGSDLAAFQHKGVAITVSTGDSGFNGGIHQAWPSDLPTVIAVGGTTMPTAKSAKATAWYGAGSGCETDFRAATGQPAAVTALCKGHRAAADVSADADPNTGVAVYDTYAPSTGQPADWTIVGGTSASAPYIGGLFARAGHLSAVDGPNTLYAAPKADFTDVTSGNNEGAVNCTSYPGISKKLCNAGVGWDGPTGIGVPHGLGAF